MRFKKIFITLIVGGIAINCYAGVSRNDVVSFSLDFYEIKQQKSERTIPRIEREILAKRSLQAQEEVKEKEKEKLPGETWRKTKEAIRKIFLENTKVFGELMFGLEENYRGKPFKTQYSGLRADMGKKSEFSIPSNVYIIGTMNDIDRSVETFDFALRRRFVWLEVKANEVMETVLKNMLKNKDEEIISDLTDRAITLNNALSDNGKMDSKQSCGDS